MEDDIRGTTRRGNVEQIQQEATETTRAVPAPARPPQQHRLRPQLLKPGEVVSFSSTLSTLSERERERARYPGFITEL